MPDATLVLVAVCGLLCVGGGLVAVFAYVILRRTGRTLIETFGPLTGIVGALDADDGIDDTLDDAPRRRRDLRSRAQSVDFDSHIAQQGQRPPPSNPFPGAPPASGSGFTPPTSPTTWTPPETPFDAPDNLRRRRPRQDDAEDPDVLDDFLG